MGLTLFFGVGMHNGDDAADCLDHACRVVVIEEVEFTYLAPNLGYTGTSIVSFALYCALPARWVACFGVRPNIHLGVRQERLGIGT